MKNCRKVHKIIHNTRLSSMFFFLTKLDKKNLLENAVVLQSVLVLVNTYIECSTVDELCI
jgi:hypothetical protein